MPPVSILSPRRAVLAAETAASAPAVCEVTTGVSPRAPLEFAISGRPASP